MSSRKKSKAIIAALNDVLTGELTAINQYFLHAKMCEDWGFERLYKIIEKESIEEMRHAEQLIARILFLDGIPNVQRMSKVNIGENVKEILELDLALEFEALPRLNDAVALCVAEGDNGSRQIFEQILANEEEHVDWLEAQLELIAQVGLPNYLAEQIKPDA